MSDMTLAEVLKRIGRGILNVHNVRSIFRDWTGDYADAPGGTMLAALAHIVGDRVDAAYRRAFEQRRMLMTQWEALIDSGGADDAKARIV